MESAHLSQQLRYIQLKAPEREGMCVCVCMIPKHDRELMGKGECHC